MPTNPFHFKQFTITQSNAAMKVGTDGVLLGSWVKVNNPNKVLDIGTGTGLVALMLAQRSEPNTLIDAIDVDENAILDARQNIGKSPWWNRISTRQVSLEEFEPNNEYDIVVSNPPYFDTDGKNQTSRSLARQNSSLNLFTLVQKSNEMLSDNGEAAFILPITAESEILKLFEVHTFYPSRICMVKPTLSKPPSRILIQASRKKVQTQISELILEPKQRHKYSKDFSLLTTEFYL